LEHALFRSETAWRVTRAAGDRTSRLKSLILGDIEALFRSGTILDNSPSMQITAHRENPRFNEHG
jgi:hypothetical protein